jgi:hypothetical protein
VLPVPRTPFRLSRAPLVHPAYPEDRSKECPGQMLLRGSQLRVGVRVMPKPRMRGLDIICMAKSGLKPERTLLWRSSFPEVSLFPQHRSLSSRS